MKKRVTMSWHFKNLLSLVPILCLMFLSGCVRYGTWLNDVFHQTEKVKTTQELARCYLRSLRMYDELTTVALFDVLWLSATVRHAYQILYDRAYCCGYTLMKDCSARDRAMDDEYLSFYLFVSLPHERSVLLTDECSSWSICLSLDGVVYQPISIELVDVLPEYRSFFGKRATRFKQAYLLRFNAVDRYDDLIVTPKARVMKLHFRTLSYEDCVTWYLYGDGRAMPVSDFSVRPLAYDL